MEQKKDHLLLKIAIGIAAGIIIGFIISSISGKVQHAALQTVASVGHILHQVIFFMVPLIIIGFVTPAITKLKTNAGKMLFTMLIVSYISSVGAALFAMTAGYIVIPKLNIADNIDTLKTLPDLLFKLNIDPMFAVTTALFLALSFGVAIISTKSEMLEKLFNEVHNVMIFLVNKLLIPILPFFVCTTFIELTYSGLLTKQFPAFVQMVLIVLIGHFIWIAFLYTLAGIISRKNPLEVLKHYPKAYFMAIGTMSSAATLPVSLKCASKSKLLSKKIVDFVVPMGANIHLCGSVLTETFFVMGIYKLTMGTLPDISTMIIFIILLGIFAIGAPGVPGGTVTASLGIVTAILGFDKTGIGLLIAIFALQDSFGTACNVTGDGALSLMMEGIFGKDNEKEA